MGLGVVKQMKKGNMTDNWLDLNTRLIAHSKKPVLDAMFSWGTEYKKKNS